METIIVGAGLAGLAAAHHLAKQGRPVIILEGRNRIGGRAYTQFDQALSAPIELGAEWYDGSGPVNALLRGIENSPSDLVGDGAVEPNHGLLSRIRLPPDGDMSLRAALDECCNAPDLRVPREMFTGYVEGFHAAHADRVSVRWLTEVEANHPASSSDRRSSAGLQRVVEALRTGIGPQSEIRLGTTAHEIRWGRGEVEIRTSGWGDAVRGRSAIITVPLPAIKGPGDHVAALKFIPSLSDKQAAAALLEMGHATKIVLRFRSPFWHDNAQLRHTMFLHATGQPFPTWWAPESPDIPILTAWAGGPHSSRLGTTDSAALLDLAIASLAAALNSPRKEIERQLEAHYYHDWSTDPFALGAYTYVAVGGINAHRELARPVDNTLFFAGEATCGGGQNATMEGAILSGRRAADELLRTTPAHGPSASI